MPPRERMPIFKQPFLELVIKGFGVEFISPRSSVLHIDVEGDIDSFIKPSDNSPTSHLTDLCKQLAKAGVVVTEYARYEGSAGPSMIYRSGAMFSRMGNFEEPRADVLAHEYREPKYRGPK